MSCEDNREAVISPLSGRIYIPAVQQPPCTHLNVNVEMIAEQAESPVGGGSVRSEERGVLSSAGSPKNLPENKTAPALHRKAGEEEERRWLNRWLIDSTQQVVSEVIHCSSSAQKDAWL